MRNYEMRKTNNELTLKKIFFLMNNKWTEVETAYIYIYIYTYILFTAELEEEILRKAEFKPYLSWRYIDDMFFL